MTTHAIWRRLTLEELIAVLEDIGDDRVEGLSGEVHSYRGFYERNATAPSDRISTGRVLAGAYAKCVGQEMYGWKGGYYRVSLNELIYYADHGDTGPCLLGFESGEDGVYRPVVLAYDDHF